MPIAFDFAAKLALPGPRQHAAGAERWVLTWRMQAGYVMTESMLVGYAMGSTGPGYTASRWLCDARNTGRVRCYYLFLSPYVSPLRAEEVELVPPYAMSVSVGSGARGIGGVGSEARRELAATSGARGGDLHAILHLFVLLSENAVDFGERDPHQTLRYVSTGHRLNISHL